MASDRSVDASSIAKTPTVMFSVFWASIDSNSLPRECCALYTGIMIESFKVDLLI